MGRVVMSRKALFLLLLAPATIQLGAQPAKLFDKAPPEVEAALREGVAGFYQAHVDGKFRQADAFICADTKEYYYEANKPRYLSFAIQDIDWKDAFTKARLTMLVEQRLNMPGFAGKVMKVPVPSTWKIEDSKWCWHVEQQNSRMTPFGEMKGGPHTPANAGQPPGDLSLDVAGVQQGVKADKQNLQVSRDLTPATATIINAMPGPATLSLDAPSFPGVEILLDRSELNAGDKATLRVRANSKAKGQTFEIRILVGPLNTVIPIQVSIQG